MALCGGRRPGGSFCSNSVLSDGGKCRDCAEREAEARLLAAAEEANARVASCHEVVACPKCGAPVGRECTSTGRIRKTLKHPHRERWTLVQPAR